MNIGFKIAATAAIVFCVLYVLALVEGKTVHGFPGWVRDVLGVVVAIDLLSLVGGALAGVWLS